MLFRPRAAKAMTSLIALVLLAVVAAQGQKRQGKMPDVARLYRVILPVSDIERAEKFYTRLLGLQGRRVSPGRHYFDCGEVILAIVDPRADGNDWDARPNQDHVYFAVADLDAVHRRASELGSLSPVMGKIEKRPWGERSFYAKDPSGNPLCFVDAKTVFTGR